MIDQALRDLNRGEPEVRRQAIAQLRGQTHGQVIAALLRVAASDPEHALRRLALRTALEANPGLARDANISTLAATLTGMPPGEAVRAIMNMGQGQGSAMAGYPGQASQAGERRDVVGVYEMLWDCEHCDTKKLLGKTHRHCPVCGAPQDPSRRYFPSDADKVAVHDHVYVGADRVCSACGSANSARAQHCTSCGSPLDDAQEVARRAGQSTAGGQGFVAGSAQDAAREAQAAAAMHTLPARSLRRRSWKRIFLLIAVAVVGLILVAVFWKREATVTVTGHSWEREIKIERFDRQRDSSWCDSMPSGAYDVSRHREVRSHRNVPDGETCRNERIDNGDGTFREEEVCKPRYRKEPVYDYRCNYSIDRWGYHRSAKASGSREQAPAWPAVQLRECRGLGCERQGGRSETYTVHLKEDGNGKTHTCELPQARWQSIQVGAAYKSRVGVVSGSLDCDAIR